MGINFEKQEYSRKYNYQSRKTYQKQLVQQQCTYFLFLQQIGKKALKFKQSLINYIKFLNINSKQMSFSGFYIDYSSIQSQQCFLQNFNNEYYKLTETNKQLQEKNLQLKKKIDLLESQNQFQKKQINDLRKLIHKKEKRKYSKRRPWLQKKYSCQFEGCQCRYSSQVALNCHIKKKHLENYQFSI